MHRQRPGPNSPSHPNTVRSWMRDGWGVKPHPKQTSEMIWDSYLNHRYPLPSEQPGRSCTVLLQARTFPAWMNWFCWCFWGFFCGYYQSKIRDYANGFAMDTFIIEICTWEGGEIVWCLWHLVHPPSCVLQGRNLVLKPSAGLTEMNDLAKKLNIRIHGAYSCPNEHTFYFILESDDLKAITAFFSGIMLTNNKGRFLLSFSQRASDTLSMNQTIFRRIRLKRFFLKF